MNDKKVIIGGLAVVAVLLGATSYSFANGYNRLQLSDSTVKQAETVSDAVGVVAEGDDLPISHCGANKKDGGGCAMSGEEGGCAMANATNIKECGCQMAKEANAEEGGCPMAKATNAEGGCGCGR